MKNTWEAERYDKDPLTAQVIGCAIEVHRHLGPGLLESTYEQCLAHELSMAGLPFRLQVSMPVYYKRVNIDCGYRIDVFIDDYLVVELKAIEQLSNLHRAQILTYMKIAEAPVGLLINFNVKFLKDGIQRFVL